MEGAGMFGSVMLCTVRGTFRVWGFEPKADWGFKVWSFGFRALGL